MIVDEKITILVTCSACQRQFNVEIYETDALAFFSEDLTPAILVDRPLFDGLTDNDASLLATGLCDDCRWDDRARFPEDQRV